MLNRAVARRGADLLRHESFSPNTKQITEYPLLQASVLKRPVCLGAVHHSKLRASAPSRFSRHHATYTRKPFNIQTSIAVNVNAPTPSFEASVTRKVHDFKTRRHGRLVSIGMIAEPWALSRHRLQIRPLDRRRWFQSSALDRSTKESQSKSIAESAKASAEAAAKATGGQASSKHAKGRLAQMPQMPHLHRPTKEELLAAATGFWSRLKVRFKWFSIRSVRPFNVDEISGFLSWLLVGHVIWIVLGTTTFFSLAIWAINTVFAQETLAGWVGNYLTKSSGIKVVFESAIVPKWGDGVITFKNVFVSRRPGQGNANVSKGSPETAAAAAALAASTNIGSRPDSEVIEDQNYTQFDLSLDTVNVTLSFAKWFNGKGLLRDVEIKGLRGVVDRTHVHWPGEYIDPKTYRHEHNPGDFEIDTFKLDDVLVTVYQPNSFRPYSVSIFSAELPQLRRQWLFYDFLSAKQMSGSFDNSLFTIHPRQTHNYTGARLDESSDKDAWKKQSRFRIDGLNVDHLNRGVEGPFSWIREGNVDIVADIMFPADNDESIAKVMSDFYDRMEATVTSNRFHDHTPLHSSSSPSSTFTSTTPNPTDPSSSDLVDRRHLLLDLRVHLNDVRAVVPLFTRDLSYINNALIRPIVAYINTRRTFIPVQCRLIKPLGDFDGSWTIYDSGLMEGLSEEVYEAFARDVQDERARLRRFKKVGLWSLQVLAQAVFMGLAGGMA